MLDRPSPPGCQFREWHKIADAILGSDIKSPSARRRTGPCGRDQTLIAMRRLGADKFPNEPYVPEVQEGATESFLGA